MPDLVDPLEPGGPPVGAWALALVRQRASLAGKVRGGGDARHRPLPRSRQPRHRAHDRLPLRRGGDPRVERARAAGDGESRSFRTRGARRRRRRRGAATGVHQGHAHLPGTLRAVRLRSRGVRPSIASISDRWGVRGGRTERHRGGDGDSVAGGTSRQAQGGARRGAHRGEENGRAGWVAAGGFLSGLFGSKGVPMTEEEEEMTLRAIRARVGELESSFRTSLEEDEAAAAATRRGRRNRPRPRTNAWATYWGCA